MRLATFFDKFEQFADAPDAVGKIRELVLQLAVRGKLVDRTEDDGDAGQLLKAISCERIAQSSTLRTPQVPESAEDNGHLFPIPTTWVWAQLGTIALQIQYGYTAS